MNMKPKNWWFLKRNLLLQGTPHFQVPPSSMENGCPYSVQQLHDSQEWSEPPDGNRIISVKHHSSLMAEIQRSPVEVSFWNDLQVLFYIPGGCLGFLPLTTVLPITCQPPPNHPYPQKPITNPYKHPNHLLMAVSLLSKLQLNAFLQPAFNLPYVINTLDIKSTSKHRNTLPKFNSSPLKSYRLTIEKDRLPTIILQGRKC